MVKWLPLLALALLGFAGRPGTAPRYVPPTGWRNNGWAVPFHEEWFGGQLRAMHEPPLATAADLGSWSRRFRLLVLPSFRPGLAFRIDEDGKGGARMREVLLDGRGGYEPGAIAKESERSLTSEEVAWIDRAIEAAGLRRLPMQPPQPQVKNGTIMVCADGTMFVFELLDGRGRSFQERGCIEPEKPLRALIEAVSRLDPVLGERALDSLEPKRR
ncbi:MAG TPA: hypothetical protein VFW19_07750 [Allosphingosinicella sp.]|nr:hypothetical protein [Allosphingosinicella sp.]